MRYLLLAGADYYPAGIRDVVGVFTSIADAQAAFARTKDADWGEIGEIHTHDVIPIARYAKAWKPWHECWESEL